jgi:hypothetical protein
MRPKEKEKHKTREKHCMVQLFSLKEPAFSIPSGKEGDAELHY